MNDKYIVANENFTQAAVSNSEECAKGMAAKWSEGSDGKKIQVWKAALELVETFEE